MRSPQLAIPTKFPANPFYNEGLSPWGICGVTNAMPTPKKPAATKRKPTAALMKPVQPDDALAKVVGSKPIPRGELTKKLWDYIKKNKLQDEKKRTQINADDALKVIFGGKKSVTMFEMTKLVSGHIKS